MMILKTESPGQSLDKAYRKQAVTRTEIELFKAELRNVFSSRDDNQDEDYHKNVMADFLRDVYCKGKYLVNVNKSQDLVVRHGNSPNDLVGVILEFKSPKYKQEMVSKEKSNVKALQELVLYYLRETVDKKRHEVRHLIVTNFDTWFIFDGQWFENNIYRNNKLISEYRRWINNGDTEHFYKLVAKPFLDEIEGEVKCTTFDLRDFKKTVEDDNPLNDEALIDLYKILSPVHLLKQPFANDSNSLDDGFYTELLHIIGLKEVKVGGRKLIQRMNGDARSEGALIENTISAIKRSVYFLDNKEDTTEEAAYEVALELCITWLNRILFMKLLEGQLVAYHRSTNRAQFRFMDADHIKDYDELHELFFEVLAERERSTSLTEKYGNVPYLNSSLFEQTALEKAVLGINQLKDRFTMPVFKSTVLHDVNHKRVTGSKLTLQYLLDFLRAYDFASDGTSQIQEENKTIINASVLGLIFEKINGYKEGAFFTPGYVTMYMCRETVRRCVIGKFNAQNGWECKDMIELSNKITVDTPAVKNANATINSLRICDPAVGSGHFLVSALNEILAIKSELGVLVDREGKLLKDYSIEVDNDELVVTHGGDIYEYNYRDPKSRRVQETLFLEKQQIIENCLFGVDINPKSVIICRLRLWIELLKHSFYTTESNYSELETLPNIDINIKCGNSLLSRLALDKDISGTLKQIGYDVVAYRELVRSYRKVKNRDTKREIQSVMEGIKEAFRVEISRHDKNQIDLKNLRDDMTKLHSDLPIFEMADPGADTAKKQTEIEGEIKKVSERIKDVNKSLHNAFEWRYEYPEVLSDNGDFLGFDAIIGNPPYLSAVTMARESLLKQYWADRYPHATGAFDIYVLFLLLGTKLIAPHGAYCWIVPNRFLVADYAKQTKAELLKQHGLTWAVDISSFKIFAEAGVYPIIIFGEGMVPATPFVEYSVQDISDLRSGKILPRSTQREYKTLKDFGLRVGSGATGFQAQQLKPLIGTTSSISTIPFVVSGNVDRYYWDNENVRYMGELYKNAFISNGPAIADSKWKMWNNPKIVIAGMTRCIEAVYCLDPLGLGVGIYAIHEFGGIDPYCLTGILNSKFVSWFLREEFRHKHLAGGYLAINKSTIEQLPLVSLSKKNQSDIAMLVHKMIAQKQVDPNVDALQLEMEIDRYVYNIYNLSSEEIAVIEEN